MRSRLTKLFVTVAALASLAIGGSTFASAAHKTAPPAPAATVEAATSDAADTDSIQQGDQTGSNAADTQSEQAASESGPSDGPGGYADTNANADTQQQGEH